ncbi:hypothetical protein M0805_007908 [Coniferiporia weirii]|nr:hypothetical protein M0805_007908 [Coniferiporia weirii]
MSLAFLWYIVAAFTLCISYAFIWRPGVLSSRFPPGPPADPFIGHTRKIPRRESWKTYAAWKQYYGDVIYAHAPGHSILILNSVAAARDLLEKKSMAFSDRPYIPIINLMGWELTLPVLRYGNRFRKHRRMMQQNLGHQAVSSFRHIQEGEVRKFMRRLLAEPDGFLGHIHRFIAGTVILITYGHEVVDDDDALAEMVERAMYMTASAGSVGTTLLDLVPVLRHVPVWVPGMSLKRLALEIREVVKKVMAVPYAEVMEKRASGTARPSVISNLLDEYEDMNVIDHEHEEDIKIFGTTIYNAGVDTTKSTITTFFLMMTLHPEVVKKAQEEIDAVVGTDRLPTLDDRKSLPYIDCILREVFRIQPPLPLGFPHRSTQTEYYRGWTIPEGSMAIPNIWQMMRDEDFFPNPDVFSPERHANKLTANSEFALDNENLDGDTTFTVEEDPSSIVFGFGRRVCPGKFFVDTIVWITMASALAAFDIRSCKNPRTGVEEPPNLEFENEAIRSPKAFKCAIVPRSAKYAQMIRDEV